MMVKRKPRKSDEKGQATIEFALTLILGMSFIMFFIQLSLMFAWGNYVHYATFLSARAYLAAGPTVQDQQERATAVITQMLKKGPGSNADRLPFVAKGEDAGTGGDITGLGFDIPDHFKEGVRESSWMQGVRYTFRSRLFPIPMGKGPRPGTIQLTSESWLGREPSYIECLELQMKPKMGVFDNGC